MDSQEKPGFDYEQYFRTAMMGGAVAPVVPLVCTGAIRYRGQAALQRDIDNLNAALTGVPHVAAFMPAVAPSGVGENEHYKTDEAFVYAVDTALHTEYQPIMDAGFILQIDDPFLSDLFGDPELDATQRHARAEIYVAALNARLHGIPPERVRYHTCYGINHGPRVHEPALADVVGYMLKVRAGDMGQVRSPTGRRTARQQGAVALELLVRAEQASAR